MSSPGRSSNPARSSPATTTTTTTPQSSPSRARLRDSRSGRVNGARRHGGDGGGAPNDSPARQLYEEFERLYVHEESNFRHSLDAQAAEQERRHQHALTEALEHHEAVRQSAERARERLELEIRREKQRREEEEKRAVEEARRRAAEQEAAVKRRELEYARRREEERKQLEALDREKAEQERRAAAEKKQREENERAQQREAARQREEAQQEAARRKEEADRKAKEDAAVKERAQQQQQPNGTAAAARPAASVSTPAGGAQLQPSGPSAAIASHLVSSVDEREAVHRRYVDLHKRLKDMRKSIARECKQRGFKQLSDWRREIRKNCGQLNKVSREDNRKYLGEVRKILAQAKTITEPSIDVTQYLIFGHDTAPASVDGVDPRYPGVLFYLLNILAKAAIAQLIQESGVDMATADPVGVLACSIFSHPEFRWNGQSLIDILWAKYHVLCPALFGIYGPENTEAGRARIGWYIDRDLDDNGDKLPTGAAVSPDAHYQRMTGLGAGFSALTLRDFSKSNNRNPTPNRLWWESLARIVNTPAGAAQTTHYVLVKAMINEFVPRIMQIFGGAGKVALRKAVCDFPRVGPTTKPRRDGEQPRLLPAVMEVETMQLTLQQKYGLTL